jgi:hypothetical protein
MRFYTKKRRDMFESEVNTNGENCRGTTARKIYDNTRAIPDTDIETDAFFDPLRSPQHNGEAPTIRAPVRAGSQ